MAMRSWEQNKHFILRIGRNRALMAFATSLLALGVGYSVVRDSWFLVMILITTGLTFWLIHHPVVVLCLLILVSTNGYSNFDLPGPLDPLDILFLALIWAIVAELLMHRASLPGHLVNVPWVTFILLMLTSGLSLGSPMADSRLLAWGTGYVMYLSIALFARREQDLRWLVISFLLGGLVFAGRNLWAMVLNWAVSGYAVSGLLRSGTEYRYALWLWGANATTWYLSLVVSFSFGLLLWARQRWLRWLCLVTMVVAIVVVALATSRSGLITTVIGLALVPLLNLRTAQFQRAVSAFVVGAIGLGIGWLVFTDMPQFEWAMWRLLDAARGGESVVEMGRIGLWKQAASLFARSPLFGHGANSPGWHSFFITMLVRYGVPGMSIIIWLFVSLYQQSVRAYAARLPGWLHGVALGCLASLIVATIQSVADSTFNTAAMWGAAFFFLRGFEIVLLRLKGDLALQSAPASQVIKEIGASAW